jgi:hypothetical protein
MVNIELTGVAHDLITPVRTDAPLNPSGGCSGPSCLPTNDNIAATRSMLARSKRYERCGAPN